MNFIFSEAIAKVISRNVGKARDRCEGLPQFQISSVLIAIGIGLTCFSAWSANDTQSGVWQGKIGPHQIIACFNSNDSGHRSGSYYYLRHLRPIALSKVDETRRSWIESSQDASQRRWTINLITERTLEGQWQSDLLSKTTLPIHLTRVPLV